MTGATVVIEGQEVPEMAQTMIRRKPLFTCTVSIRRKKRPGMNVTADE